MSHSAFVTSDAPARAPANVPAPSAFAAPAPDPMGGRFGGPAGNRTAEVRAARVPYEAGLKPRTSRMSRDLDAAAVNDDDSDNENDYPFPEGEDLERLNAQVVAQRQYYINLDRERVARAAAARAFAAAEERAVMRRRRFMAERNARAMRVGGPETDKFVRDVLDLDVEPMDMM